MKLLNLELVAVFLVAHIIAISSLQFHRKFGGNVIRPGEKGFREFQEDHAIFKKEMKDSCMTNVFERFIGIMKEVIEDVKRSKHEDESEDEGEWSPFPSKSKMTRPKGWSSYQKNKGGYHRGRPYGKSSLVKGKGGRGESDKKEVTAELLLKKLMVDDCLDEAFPGLWSKTKFE